jgi:SAM-dependent methyltransferase
MDLMPRPGADYGIDAPYVPITLGVTGLIGLVVTIAILFTGTPLFAIIALLYAIFFLTSAAIYLHTTRSGKFAVWSEILSDLNLDGDERVLDIGCGRGAVLMMAAKLLTTGTATGIDLWELVEQMRDEEAKTRENAEIEGVADRIVLQTEDMRQLTFDDGQFDLVIASLAIHNIPAPEGRADAVREAARVLKPGGLLLIADFRSTDEYVETLESLDMTDISKRNLGWRYWYGGPWGATKLVSANKPEAPE